MHLMNQQTLPRHLGDLYSTLAVEHPTTRHLVYEFTADVP